MTQLKVILVSTDKHKGSEIFFINIFRVLIILCSKCACAFSSKDTDNSLSQQIYIVISIKSCKVIMTNNVNERKSLKVKENQH